MSHTWLQPRPRASFRFPRPALALIAGLVLFIPYTASATIDTVYVDNTKSPGGNGTSLANAFSSIRTALSTSTGVTGGPDTVFAIVGTGVPYRELANITIAATDSGTVGHPFVIMARGTVIIDGSNEASTWTAVPNNSTMWRTSVPSAATSANQVFLNGVPLPYVAVDDTIEVSELPLIQPGRCQIIPDADSVYVNFGTHGNHTSVDPTGITGYVSLRDFRIAASNVTIQGLTIRRSNNDGISLVTNAVRNVTIANCDVRQSFDQGFMPNSNPRSHHCTIRDNVFSENGSHGIFLPDTITDFTLLRNTCAYNVDVLAYLNNPAGRSSVNGIRLGGRPGNAGPISSVHNHLLEGNVAHHNQDSGIEIRANNTLLRYNQSYSNQDHGYDHLSCTDNTHIGDLAWGNNRDGMSFENNSRNHTLRNCVIANNGHDRSRVDWEIEHNKSSLTNFSSDNNVIWRASSGETLPDTVLIKLKGSSDCTSADSCFGTLARFQAAFTGLEQHSRSGQPTYVDSTGASFNPIPLSTSSVLDGADAAATGYLANDLRGYYRHDAQAKEPNTGTGGIDYADIGPYEWDVAETPTAPSLACYRGRYDAAIQWSSTQYNGDESSRYEALNGEWSFESGATAPSGVANCVHAPDLAECTHFTFGIRITDANTGYYSTSTCTLSTKCSGSTYVYCGDGLVAGGGDDESLVAELEGSQSGNLEPKNLDLRIATVGTGRAVLYAIPREHADMPFDLGVFDVAGRLVMTVARGPSRVGRFSTALNRSSPGLGKAGVYFVRMRIGSTTLRKSVVLW